MQANTNMISVDEQEIHVANGAVVYYPDVEQDVVMTPAEAERVGLALIQAAERARSNPNWL